MNDAETRFLVELERRATVQIAANHFLAALPNASAHTREVLARMGTQQLHFPGLPPLPPFPALPAGAPLPGPLMDMVRDFLAEHLKNFELVFELEARARLELVSGEHLGGGGVCVAERLNLGKPSLQPPTLRALPELGNAKIGG